MAVTITASAAAVAIRAATNETAISDPVQTVLDVLFPAAQACVLDYAPNAPDAVHNAALVRLLGWLWDADPTETRISDALQISGGSALLAAWREHRAGIVGAAAAPGVPSNIPEPGEGTFVLVAEGGAIKWIPFPLPE